jgi:hypothetical protein
MLRVLLQVGLHIPTVFIDNVAALRVWHLKGGDGGHLNVAKANRSAYKFDMRVSKAEKLVPTRLVMADKPDRVRLVKKHGYTLAVGTRPITQEQVRKFLDEFP